MPSDVVIKVNELGKCYPASDTPFRQVISLLLGRQPGRDGGFQALHPISFEVRRGETLAIIGRNGAGKSTLLQLICGTLTPSSGSVSVRGRLAALLELGAGFNPEFSGRENIYLSAAVYGLTRLQVHERLDAIINFAQIGEQIDQPVKTYSSGMFVRLAFAVIAHVDADILVIDEALAVGDAYFTQKCMRFLREFAERGTLLFVSHDTHSVTNLCSKAIWIDRGRMMLAADAKTTVEAYLSSFYTGTEDSKAVLVPSTDNEQCAAVPPRTMQQQANNFASAFGVGGGRLLACRLLDQRGRPIFQLTEAQTVELQVDCLAEQCITQPIVGFFIKDRLGQPICGVNTLEFLPDWQQLPAGVPTQISFRFHLPLLATGDYTVTTSLASGTQAEHIQHHWVHDMLSFKAAAGLHLSGLFTLDEVSCRQTPSTDEPCQQDTQPA